MFGHIVFPALCYNWGDQLYIMVRLVLQQMSLHGAWCDQLYSIRHRWCDQLYSIRHQWCDQLYNIRHQRCDQLCNIRHQQCDQLYIIRHHGLVGPRGREAVLPGPWRPRLVGPRGREESCLVHGDRGWSVPGGVRSPARSMETAVGRSQGA